MLATSICRFRARFRATWLPSVITLSLAGAAHGAPITWSAPANASADSNVTTTGTLKYAYNLTTTNQTVNGVLFTGTSSATALGTNVGMTFASTTTTAYTSTSSPFSGLSTAYKAMLVGGAYRDSGTSVTVTLKNLTIGSTYTVQVWVSDPRATTRTQALSSSGGNTVTLDFNSTNAAGGVGQYSIGTFTAGATTQDFVLTASSTQLNALQVRESVASNTFWSGETDANWDDATVNFSGQTFATVASTFNTATFADTRFNGTPASNPNVTVQAAGVSVGSVLFTNTAALTYTFQNAAASTTGITGATTVSKAGTGTVVFSGANTYTGITTLGAGTLQANHAAALGSGNINFTGGKLQYGTGITTDWSAKVTNSNAAVAVDTNGNTVTWASALAASNTAGLNKSGAGTLTLSGANSYMGSTTVSAGTLSLSQARLPDASTVEVAASATLDLGFAGTDTIDTLTFGGVAQAPGTWGAIGNASATYQDARITGTGMLLVDPANSYWDGTGLSWNVVTAWSSAAAAATPDLGTVPDSNNIANFNTTGTNAAQSVGLDGDQSALGLKVTSTGAVSFHGGDADHSLALGGSGITINAGAGALTLGSATAGDRASLNLTAGQTWTNNSANTVTAVNAVSLGSSALTLAGSGAFTLSGPVSGTGSLAKNTTGTATLSGTNSYTGGTATTAGTLNVSGDQSAANGDWNIGIAGANTTTVNFTTGSTIAVASGKTFRVGNNVAGGTTSQTANVSGSVTNQGTLYVGRPGNLNLNTGGSWSQSGAMSLNGQGGYSSALTINTGATMTYTGAGTIGLNPASDNGGSALLTIAGGTLTTGQGFTYGTSSGAIGTGTGQLVLSEGGVLMLSANMPALTAGAVGGTFKLGHNGGVIDTQEFSATLATTLGEVTGNSASFTKRGTGTLTLTSASSYTGKTTVSAGTLVMGSAAIADTSTVEISTGAILQLDHGATDKVGALTFDGAAQEPGIWGAPGSGATHESARLAGTGFLEVDPYISWLAAHPGVTGADQAKTADPDHDGRNNAAEFAFDGDPLSGANDGKMRNAFATFSGFSYLTLTIPVRTGVSFGGAGPMVSSAVGGVTYQVEGGGDLTSFTGGIIEITPALSENLPGLDAGWEYRTFSLTDPTSTQPKGFIRCKVTAP